jgi:hypothetical protein
MKSHGTAETGGVGESGREQLELWERSVRVGTGPVVMEARVRAAWLAPRQTDPAQLALEVEAGKDGVGRGRGPGS